MVGNGIDGDVADRMVAVNKSYWASVVSSSSVEVETVEIVAVIVVVVDCTVGVVDEASLVVKVILEVVGDVVFRMMTVVHMGCFVDPFCPGCCLCLSLVFSISSGKMKFPYLVTPICHFPDRFDWSHEKEPNGK